jgi:hypothetical protein
MKLNQRDKIILIGILVVLIWIVGVIMFIKPAVESVQSASQTLDAKEMELASDQALIKQDENLPQDVDDAYDAATELAGVFYDKMAQHTVATEVQDQLDEHNITNLSLTISQLSSLSLSRYTYEQFPTTTALDTLVDSVGTTDDGSAESVDAAADTSMVDVSNYSISFSYECTKGDLLKFLQDIQTNAQRSLVVSSVTIADVGDNTDSTEITGSMSLDFMMVPELPNPEDVDNAASDTTVTATEE